MTVESAFRGAVIDFDGTLSFLDIDWEGLRADLGVERLSDLWGDFAPSWDAVTAAEIASARTSVPNQTLIDYLQQFEFVAVLSNNSERSIRVFLERFQGLESYRVYGREYLQGPKQNWKVFSRAIHTIVEQTSLRKSSLIYLGDSDYELEFAQRLGISSLRVHFPDNLADEKVGAEIGI